MKQGNVWDNSVTGQRVDEFKLTYEGTDWTVRRIQHHDTGDVEYKRRDLNRFHSRFKKVPSSWENAIDRAIDENEPFKVPS